MPNSRVQIALISAALVLAAGCGSATGTPTPQPSRVRTPSPSVHAVVIPTPLPNSTQLPTQPAGDWYPFTSLRFGFVVEDPGTMLGSMVGSPDCDHFVDMNTHQTIVYVCRDPDRFGGSLDEAVTAAASAASPLVVTQQWNATLDGSPARSLVLTGQANGGTSVTFEILTLHAGYEYSMRWASSPTTAASDQSYFAWMAASFHFQAAGPNPAASVLPGVNGGTLTLPAHGLAITFPAGWIVLDQDTAANPTALAQFKAQAGPNSSVVDELSQELTQTYGLWFAGSTPDSQSTFSGEFDQFQDPTTWGADELATLKDTFGTVHESVLSHPRAGLLFDFVSEGSASRIYAFPREGGVTVLWFTSATTQIDSAWSSIVATFRDSGK